MEKAIKNVSSLSFRLVNNPAELEEIYAKRYQIFVKKLKVFAGTADGLDIDQYDEHSLHAGLYDENRLAAYMRLITESHHGFTFEASHPLPTFIDRQKTIECSRAFLAPGWEKTTAMWKLVNEVYHHCQKNGIRHILNYTRALLYNGFVKRGLPICYSWEPAFFHGHKTIPCIVEVRPGLRFRE